MVTAVAERQMKTVTSVAALTKKRYYLKMSANGQITIPKEMREEFGWQPGDTVVFVPRKTGCEVYKQRGLREDLDEWRRGLSQETREMIKKTAGWTMNQYHEYFDGLPENVAEMERRYGLK